MYLYRMEVELEDQSVQIVVMAETDEQAFTYADAELEKHFTKMPTINEAALVEKKPVRKGTGYVIELN